MLGRKRITQLLSKNTTDDSPLAGQIQPPRGDGDSADARSVRQNGRTMAERLDKEN